MCRCAILNCRLVRHSRSISTLFLFSEKLDFVIITAPTRKKRSAITMGKSKGYRELNEKDKRHCLGALLTMRDDHGELQRGAYTKIARNLGVEPRSVSRLWRLASTTRANGKVHTPDTLSRKGHREPHLVYDREQLRQETLTVPLWKRSTVRNLAAELKMPKSTLHDILKKEKDEVIHHHTSRLKVHLNEEQMFQRILYCFSMTRWRRTRTRQKCF